MVEKVPVGVRPVTITSPTVSVCRLQFQLFTEYGRLAMEETFLKPFQVPFQKTFPVKM